VDSDLRTLRERLAEISDLHRSMGVLFWDQKVTMPPGGHPARAEALSTLSRIAHEKFVDDEIGALLERLRPLEESLEFDSDDASLVRVTRRDWEKQHRVPTELRAEMTRAAAQGLGSELWTILATAAAQVALLAALWLALSLALPRPAVRWTALVPGALLFAGGFQAFSLAVTLYFAPRAARASTLYGSLGVALVLLASLFLVGRLAVTAAELNATLWERRAQRRRPNAPPP